MVGRTVAFCPCGTLRYSQSVTPAIDSDQGDS